MDRKTFSQYGWIVVTVIIIAILIGATTPFVDIIKAKFQDVTIGIKDVQNGALDNIDKVENPFGDKVETPDDDPAPIVPISVAPGLYRTGSNYTEMITPWDVLVANGTVHVEDGMVYTNCTGAGNATANDSSDALAGDLFLPDDGSITGLKGNYSQEDGAFKDCVNLTGIIIPEGVTEISECAFERCYALTGVGVMGSGASVIVPSTVTKISRYAFYSCTGLTEVNIPGTVKWIGEMESSRGCVFNGCENMQTLVLNEGIERIGRDAFSGCDGLTAVHIPDSVSELGAYAFSNIANLASVTFGQNCQISAIGGSAFSYCKGLTEVELPESVNELGSNAFYSCSNLKNIQMPTSMTSIGANAFRDCGKLENIVIPSGVTTINNSTFAYCYKLASVSIPDGVTKIGDAAFQNCSSLDNVVLPAELTSIGNDAFNGCSGFTNFEFKGTTTEWNSISKGSYWRAGIKISVITCSNRGTNF